MTGFPLVATASPKGVVFTSADGLTHHIPHGHPRFATLVVLVRAIETARRAGNEAAVQAGTVLLGQVSGVVPVAADRAQTFRIGATEVRDNAVTHEGERLGGALAERIVWGMREGMDTPRMLTFVERLMANPSARVVGELYDYVERSGLAIDDEGRIIGYTIVGQDFRRPKSEAEHKPGMTVTVRRNRVKDDPALACDIGLTFGRYPHYEAAQSGGKLIAVRVDPADVVAVPPLTTEPARACRYEVLSVCAVKPIEKPAEKPPEKPVAAAPAPQPAPQAPPKPEIKIADPQPRAAPHIPPVPRPVERPIELTREMMVNDSAPASAPTAAAVNDAFIFGTQALKMHFDTLKK